MTCVEKTDEMELQRTLLKSLQVANERSKKVCEETRKILRSVKKNNPERPKE